MLIVPPPQRSEVLIFAIGILNEADRRPAKRAERAMDMLARQSGAIAHFPKDVEDLGEVALQIAKEIRSQYFIAYAPTKTDDGSFRQVKVTVKAPGNPTVRPRPCIQGDLCSPCQFNPPVDA